MIKKLLIGAMMALTFSAILCGSFLLISGLPSYEKCRCEYNNETKNVSEEKRYEFLTNSRVICYVRFWDRHNGLVTAFATVGIFVFTFYLFWVSYKQFGHSYKVERAYLSGGGDFDMGSSATLAPPRITFWWDINNDGKTVAYLTHYAVRPCDLEDLKKPDEVFDVGTIYGEPIHYPDVINPGRIGKKTNAMEPIEIPKTANPVVYGRFWYEDIWGKPHFFSFIQRLKNGRSYSGIPNIHPKYRERT